MTSERLRQNLTTIVATGAILALGAAGAYAQLRHAEGRQAILSIAAFAGAAIVAQWLVAVRERREQVVVRGYLDTLGHADPNAATPISNLQSLPALDPGSPWSAPLARVRDCLASFQERREQAETARAALEIRLRRSADQQELVSSVLSNIGEPILAINQYDEIRFANSDAERLLELGSPGEEKRRLKTDRLPEKLNALLHEVRGRDVPTRRTDDVEFTGADGASRWYRVTAANVVGDRSAGDGGAVVVMRDVSTQRDMQRQHAEFVSAASHEMKAPLAGIKAYVELLADGDAADEKSRDEFLGIINGQTDRLQRLIDNLLNIARIEAGVVKVSKQSRGVNEILAEAAGVVQPNAEAKQITLTTDLSPLYLGAMVDRDMLLQAVINLLSNAVKYTPRGGTVTLRSRLADDQILIEVEDTGVGLSEDDCRRVFEKFYRVEKDKNMAAGTGLGLALAKHIAEDVHGGKLTVRSKLGVGSTFAVAIPHVARRGAPRRIAADEVSGVPS